MDGASKKTRAAGAGFFSYGDLTDEITRKQMDDLIAAMKKSKKEKMKLFTFLIWSCGSILFGKLILAFVKFGDKIDGEGNTVLKKQIVPLWFPGVEKWSVYIFAVVVCYITQIWVMVNAFGFILSWIAFIEELKAQLEIVGIGLRRVTARARHVYVTRYADKRFDKVRYSKCIKATLKASVIHHTMILQMCQDFKRLSSIPMLTLCGNSALLLCLQGFMLIERNVSILAKVTSSVFLLTELLYVFVFFANADKMTSASEQIGTQLYLDDWTSISDVVYPYMAIIKRRTSKPFTLTAGGFIECNLAAFTNVISSSYSYFNLMLSNKK